MNEFRQNLLREFMEPLGRLHQLISDDFSENNRQEALRLVHSVKGCARTFGLKRSATHAADLESILAGGVDDDDQHSLVLERLALLIETLNRPRIGAESLEPLPSREFVSKFSFNFCDIDADGFGSLTTGEKAGLFGALESGRQILFVEESIGHSELTEDFGAVRNRLSRSGNVIAVLPGVPDDEVSSKFRFLIACDEGRQHEFRNYSTLAPGSPKQDTNFHAEVSEHVARIVNDSGKIVRFRAILGDVMIGDHVKRAFEILMHLTSNAVDHGIDRFGSIELAVLRSGSGVYLSVADDGSGLESDPEDGLKLFEPGFSTLSVARRNSGRGYGLNIVKTEVEAVNGKISISSRKDLGTRFEIVLP